MMTNTMPMTEAPKSTQAVAAQKTMRAMVQTAYGTTDVLSLGTHAVPTPGAGEVVLAVQAAGIDRGTWHMMTGRPYLMRVMGFGFSRPNNPVPGLDVAGTVVAIGSGVTRFAVGDAVFGIAKGSFAEYACAEAEKLARVPTRLPFAHCGVLAVSGITALQALEAAGVVAGERVLVLGASGGVGTYAVQIAKAKGAIVTAVCSASKRELVRSLGADQVLDYGTGEIAEPGVRYDVILDIAGNTPVGRLRRAMTDTGRLVFVGNEHGGDYTAGFGRQLAALAIAPFVRQRFVMLMNREHNEPMEALAKLVDEGRVTPVIDRVCTLDGIVPAIRDLEAGAVRGKVLVSLGR